MRVNVDDKAITDPRLLRLGARVGMGRFAALGHCLPVWSYAYANRSAFVAAIDVDALAETQGFAAAMIEVNLATAAVDGQLRLRGVTERLEWLLNQDAKRELAAAAKRRKREAQLAEARPTGLLHGNVPGELTGDRPSDHDHDHDGDHAPEREPSRAHAIPPSTDELSPEQVNTLAVATYEQLAAARASVLAELGRREVGMTPHRAGCASESVGLRNLRERIRAEGPEAHLVCETVVANLVRQARETRSCEWLSEKAFSEGAWRRARYGGSKPARGAVGAALARNDHNDDGLKDFA